MIFIEGGQNRGEFSSSRWLCKMNLIRLSKKFKDHDWFTQDSDWTKYLLTETDHNQGQGRGRSYLTGLVICMQVQHQGDSSLFQHVNIHKQAFLSVYDGTTLPFHNCEDEDK